MPANVFRSWSATWLLKPTRKNSARSHFNSKEEDLSHQIDVARDIVDQVTFTKRDLLSIAALTASLNVDGHRSDLVILKAARAQAAFDGRSSITEHDIALAAELALPHRIKRGPFQQLEISLEDLQERISQLESQTGEDPQESAPGNGAGDEGRLKKKDVEEARGGRDQRSRRYPRVRMYLMIITPVGGKAGNRSRPAKLSNHAGWIPRSIKWSASRAAGGPVPIPTASADATSRPGLPTAKPTWLSMPPSGRPLLSNRTHGTTQTSGLRGQTQPISSGRCASAGQPTWSCSWWMHPGRWRLRNACRRPKARSYRC